MGNLSVHPPISVPCACRSARVRLVLWLRRAVQAAIEWALGRDILAVTARLALRTTLLCLARRQHDLSRERTS
jgi:hypothetical protein